jgi:hypothetical protein
MVEAHPGDARYFGDHVNAPPRLKEATALRRLLQESLEFHFAEVDATEEVRELAKLFPHVKSGNAVASQQSRRYVLPFQSTP